MRRCGAVGDVLTDVNGEPVYASHGVKGAASLIQEAALTQPRVSLCLLSRVDDEPYEIMLPLRPSDESCASPGCAAGCCC